jgi:mono/diheme cytochrome c family protein
MKRGTLFWVLLYFISCTSTPEYNGIVPPARDLLKGKQLYLSYCAGCHQNDGSGLGKVYPPLKNSDYLAMNFESLSCIIINGLSDTIVVNGQKFQYEMYPIKGLGYYDVAAISNYLAFTHQVGNGTVLTQEMVKQKLRNCQ